MSESHVAKPILGALPVGIPAALLSHLEFLGDWGILATDADLKVTVWSRWLVQRTDLAAASVVGRPLLTTFPDLEARGLDRHYNQVLAGKPIILSQALHQYLLPMSTGLTSTQLACMQQSVRIIPVMEGDKVTGTVTLIEDVTERVTHEAELLARARRQAAIAVAARAALTGTEVDDLAREIVTLIANTLDVQMVEVLEYLPREDSWARLAGIGWSKPEIVVFETRSAPRTSAISNGDFLETDDASESAVLIADKHLREHSVHGLLIVRVPGRTNQVFGLIGAYSGSRRQFSPEEIEFVQSIADVLAMTIERKRLEAELRVRVSELAEADQRKDEFLAMLAHELRNPLAPVRNGLLILRLVEDKPQIVTQTREMIDRQVQHLSRLVDDLLDVSRITRGKVELRTEPVDLAEIASRAIETARPLIESKQHELNVSHHGGPVRVMADATRLIQVLGNLLNNAAKYTDTGGKISLTLTIEEGEAVAKVTDSGLGITPRMLPKVFDLFTQVEGTLDRSQGGLGIGLTLVKTLVELHNGRVEVLSEGLGKGSTFIVRLPLLLGDFADSRARIQSALPPRPFRILVVDDNVDSAESLATVLRLSGHQVRTAHTGIQALDAAQEINPEVVLLDIGLPAMDGYEVVKQLRAAEESRRALVIAMTGYGSEEDRRKSKEAGFDHHLVKPVDLSVVNRLLEEQAVEKTY